MFTLQSGSRRDEEDNLTGYTVSSPDDVVRLITEDDYGHITIHFNLMIRADVNGRLIRHDMRMVGKVDKLYCSISCI